MYKIFDEVYLGSVIELPKLKERKFDACLSISDRIDIHNDTTEEIREDGDKIIIPNLNIHKINHMILSLGENSPNQIGTILPFIYKFIDKNKEKRIFIHCLSGENQSVAVLFAYMINKGIDPIAAYTAIITTKINAQPSKHFITEILDLAGIKEQDKIIEFIGSDFEAELKEDETTNEEQTNQEHEIDDKFIEKMIECKSLQTANEQQQQENKTENENSPVLVEELPADSSEYEKQLIQKINALLYNSNNDDDIDEQTIEDNIVA